MRFRGAPEEILGSRDRVRMLAIFMRFPTKLFTGREAGRLAGVSETQAWRALKVLESHGILFRQRIGRSDAWRLEQGHYIVEAFRKLASFEKDSVGELKRLLLRRLQGVAVERIVLFGSTARGDSRPDSDIDVLVVIPGANKKEAVLSRLYDAAADIQFRFGNSMIPIVYTVAELHRKRGLPLVKNIDAEGKVLYERGTAEDKAG